MADPKRKGYRVVAVSLYQDQADEADVLTEILKSAGWHKANRSLVIREALAYLQAHLRGKSAEDVFRYFLEHFSQSRHISAKALGRLTPPSMTRERNIDRVNIRR